VVFRAIGGRSELAKAPLEVPAETTALAGIAAVVSSDNIPNALTIRLPTEMRNGQAYGLWIHTTAGEWSQGIAINDPRPLWLSPAFVYASAAPAWLPRRLKLVGRNLKASEGAPLEVQLSGPQTISLRASVTPPGRPDLEDYVASLTLPERLAPGRYAARVRRGTSEWVELPGQVLEVRADPAMEREFPVSESAYGACKPNDDRDDTPCVRAAIAAAAASGGGTVVLGSGTWQLSARTGLDMDGIVVPQGVNLRGAGRDATTVVRAANWGALASIATFTLAGRNTVRGIAFRDARIYRSSEPANPMLQLGMRRFEDGGRNAALTAPVADIAIFDNIFAFANQAIADGGLPVQRLFVTGNEFGAFATALYLGGSRYNVRTKFNLEDVVVAGNTFKPGSYIDVPAGQGTMASELGAGRRVDFSDNIADGSATDYLYGPDDPRGWRAAYFFHLNNNQEMVLASGNSATCTGDKAGDGESIAYDNNGNTFGFDGVAGVVTASADSVTVGGTLRRQQNERFIPLDSYYVGHWVHVGMGPGLGQARKIIAYSADAASGRVTFKVSPEWDVVPEASRSRVTVNREFWQVYTLGNTIDNRTPTCRKSNRTWPKAGVIVLWGHSADSVIAANRQFDSDGIELQLLYSAPEKGCAECDQGTFLQSALAVRDNRIEGEYDWKNDCSSAGIYLSTGLSPHAPPVTAGFGIDVSHNYIARADGTRGGAITVMPTWHQGPLPYRSPVVNNLLIHHNNIVGFDDDAATRCGSMEYHPRTAIDLAHSALSWHSVLYANTCKGAVRSIMSGTQALQVVCTGMRASSCECAR
jgi:hypothetical protein